MRHIRSILTLYDPRPKYSVASLRKATLPIVVLALCGIMQLAFMI